MIEVPEEIIAKLLRTIENTDELLQKVKLFGDSDAWVIESLSRQQAELRAVKHELEERAAEKKSA